MVAHHAPTCMPGMGCPEICTLGLVTALMAPAAWCCRAGGGAAAAASRALLPALLVRGAVCLRGAPAAPRDPRHCKGLQPRRRRRRRRAGRMRGGLRGCSGEAQVQKGCTCCCDHGQQETPDCLPGFGVIWSPVHRISLAGGLANCGAEGMAAYAKAFMITLDKSFVASMQQASPALHVAGTMWVKASRGGCPSAAWTRQCTLAACCVPAAPL